MTQGMLWAHRRERAGRMMPLERTGAFTLACVAVLVAVAILLS
jgi:cytochrome c oxidase assembly factor CtaG